MAMQWSTIKIPAELAARLERLAIEADARHAAGKSKLPNGYADRCPIHYVISLSLDETEKHRARGKRKAKGGTKAPA